MSDPPPSNAPAGWYPDPTTPDQLRWWDGTAWQPWQHAAPAGRTTGTFAQWAWTVVVILVGSFCWLLSIALLLAEDLEYDGPARTDPVKVAGAIGFFTIPLVVVLVIVAIWIVPTRRRRRRARPG